MQGSPLTQGGGYLSLSLLQVGPANPRKTRQQLAEKNMLSGFAEPAHIDNFQFENQRRTFHAYGSTRTCATGIANQLVFEILCINFLQLQYHLYFTVCSLGSCGLQSIMIL